MSPYMHGLWHLDALRRLHAFSCDWKLHKLFFPEILQELTSHLSAGYCAWKYNIMYSYCFTVILIIIYYILCSSLHHSHHLASHLVWVPAPSHEEGRGWAPRLLPISACLLSLHHLPLH